MPSLEQRLALSTCWCSARHQDGYAMLSEMRGMGFRRVELSHGIRMSLVPGILKAVEEKIVEISSVHNFCPLPASVQHAAPNLYQPSAAKTDERRRWLNYSEKTLEFAARIGAPSVVMHSGSLRPWSRSTASVLADPDAGPEDRAKALGRLRRKGGLSGRTMGRVAEAYRVLLPASDRLGVRLAAENREGVLELPLDDDFAAFLAGFEEETAEGLPGGRRPRIDYWHDTGHARIKHRLGLLDHRRHLESVADRLTGFHFHDVDEAGKDHQPVGTGTVDFAMVREFVRPEHILVLELSPTLSPEEVAASRENLLLALSL